MSDSNRVRLAYMAESNWGVTPAATALKVMRLTSESLKQDTSTTQSNEIRDDRQISDVVRTQFSASGDVGLELSYGAHDDLLAAALMASGWVAAETVGPNATMSVSSVDNSFNDSGNGLGGLEVGRWIKTSGFTEAANNGIFKITSVAAGKIIVTGGTLVTEVASSNNTIVMGAQITNGTTVSSFTLEKSWQDLVNQFAVYVGMIPSTLSLSVSAGNIITGSIGFMGKSEDSAAATVGNAYTDAPTNDVLSATDNVLAILADNVNTDVTQFTLSLANNLRGRLNIGDQGPSSIGVGQLAVTGSLQAYFTSSTLIDKYLAGTRLSLAGVFQDAAGNTYVVDLPAVKFSSGQRTAGGANSDVIQDLPFSAHRHPTELVTIRIVRFAA